jgi:hypothetical protein
MGEKTMSKFMTVSVASNSNKVLRKDVKPFQLFRVKGQDTIYAATGTRTVPPSNSVGYQSLIVSGPKAGENAVTHKGDSAVEILGTWKIAAVLHADFAALVGKMAA